MKYLSVIELIDNSISGEWGEEPLHEPTIKVIRNTNFTNEGKLNLSEVVERSIPKIKILSKSLKFGDIIIEKSGGSPNQPVGRVVFYDQKDGEYLFSNFTSALRPRQNVHSRYLFYILYAHHCFKTTLSYQNKTTGILNLQLKRYLEETKIPLPPLETQKKIAAILDKADELRQNDKKILQKYEQLAQSVFLDMFGDLVNNQMGWPLVKFGSIFRSLKYGVSTPPIYSTNGTPFIRATNIKGGGITKNGMVYISNIEASKIEKCRLDEGDLIIVRSGANTGDCSRIPKEYQDAYGGFDIIIKIDEPYSTFYNFLLNTKSGKAVLAPLTRRAGQPHLNSMQITALEVIAPPTGMQLRFKELLENIEIQKSITLKSLQKSEELFQSLLQRAFKGELA
jgi:type I restriction enzyme S subunit